MVLDGFHVLRRGILTPAIADDVGVRTGVFAASLPGLMVAAMASGLIADR
jgi:hypothetical protein